jgi:hypothetical protein
MQKQNDLFNKMFQEIVWVGSYYKKTRVGHPKEYDVNLVINLPIKEENMKVILLLNIIIIKIFLFVVT